MTAPTTSTVLVTGGAGFLGCSVARSYMDSGIAVRAVGHLRRGAVQRIREFLPRVDFVELELCELGPTVQAFAGQDLVIHTAAVVRASSSQGQLDQHRVNVRSTQNVIEACRRNAVPMLLHVSTTGAIGISQDPALPADESFRYNLTHTGLAYNLSKYEAERLVLAANTRDLRTAVVNPGFMFGKYAGGYRGQEVIERVIRKPAVICTAGGMSVVHVDDVVDGIRRVADHGRHAERYILSGNNVTFLEIANIVCRVGRLRRVVVELPDLVRDFAGLCRNSNLAQSRGASPRLDLDRRYAYQFYSSEKARRELAYNPRSFSAIVAEFLGSVAGPGNA